MPFQFRKEAIEEDLNSNFPSQGQGNPPLYYSLSEVVVPTYSINNVAEGTSLPQNLQTAWDFSTGSAQIENTTTNLVANTGFWQIDLVSVFNIGQTTGLQLLLNDGVSTKVIYQTPATGSGTQTVATESETLVVYLRSGDTLQGKSSHPNDVLSVWYRQIADVNGNLVNPLGFSFA
jgi:hypothetical protein